MIAFLKGVLAARTADSAIIEVAGVGYAVGMSANALSKLPDVGQSVQVHTYLQVRDDGISLFGFISQEEKSLFERLISVSGVGPKVALAALSSFTAPDLVSAIAAQDVALVSRIPGVGKKTAQRIILELQGSLDDLQSEGEGAASASAGMKGATEALLSMGFTSAEAQLALKDAPQQGNEAVLLQYALKRLGE